MNLRETIESIAKSHDVDLVGFAPLEDLVLAHPPRPAEDLLPGAQTTVALAASLLWGSLNCPRGSKGAVKDALIAYHRLESAGAAIGRFLESKGYATYVPPASLPADLIREGDKKYYAAEWSHRQAAIAAKLGVRGLNNLLITPEFGPYVRLSSLITTAVIEPGQRELPTQQCKSCQLCIKACPVGALSVSDDGKPRLDQPLCVSRYIQPFIQPNPWKTIRDFLFDRSVPTLGIQSLLEGYYFSCAECQRVCPRGGVQKKLRREARARRKRDSN